MIWTEVDCDRYYAESTIVNGHVVTVCNDDEGPLRPAFYWDIDDRTIDGWASSVPRARRDAVATARTLEPIT